MQVLIINTIYAQEILGDAVLSEIDELRFLGDTLIAVQNDGDFVISLFDITTGSEIGNMMRRGQGPGEISRPAATYLDENTGNIYVLGTDRRLVGYSAEGTLIYDKLFDELPAAMSNSGSQSLILKGKYLFLSTELRIPLEKFHIYF